MGLQAFLRSGNLVPTHELRKLIEILGKMFTDAHTKVGTVFMNASLPNSDFEVMF